ncbi:MAG: c-type cytochrome [Microvirga sp.]
MLRAAAVTLVLLLTVSVAEAADPTEKLELCMSCHGENGVSDMQNVPPLAGKSSDYLAAQLKAFRDEVRQNPQMLLARRLVDAEISALAAYFAAQKVPAETTAAGK